MPSTTSLDRGDARPLWEQLLSDLRARLTAGEFDDAFPGELALVESYRVSRHTVREALRRLREEGVVTASRGRRPQRARVEVEQPLGGLSSLFATVEGNGLVQRSIVRSLDVRADGLVAVRLGLEESTPLVRLDRLRLAGEKPLALDAVWLPASLAEPLLEVDFSRTALYTELAQRCGVRLTGARERVRAVVASPAERRLLEISPQVALLCVERVGLAGERPIEYRRTLVRGDRYALTSDRTPAGRHPEQGWELA